MRASAVGGNSAPAMYGPQQRMIEPEEVAHTALMLCADHARGIHGQTLIIDGGAILK